MKLKILLMTIMTALLFIGSAAYADDAKDFPITGTVDLGVRSVQDGNSAKFQEYRDLKSGVFGNMSFGGDNGSYHVDMTGENVGRDDQFFEVKGGRYGLYNYSVHYNEIIHNLSFDARTFYANPGSTNLTYGYTGTGSHTNKTFTPDVPSNSGTWNTFDYSIKRKNTGAAIDFSLGTPFYISMDVSHNEVKGIQPWGLRSSLRSDFVSSTTGSQLELPMPVDHVTNNLNLKAGYNTKKYTFSVAGYLSRFENENPWVTFRNPYVTSDPQNNTEIISQAADNNYYKLSAQGSVRQLPLNSALAVQLGYSKLRNEFDIPATITTSTSSSTSGVNPVYSPVTLNLNKPTFTGDITYQTASLALTSEPVKALDTKIYYNYLRKENNSDIITFQNPTALNTITSTELFDYRKNNFGADVGYKFLPKTKATVGFEFQKVDRERLDAESTTDNSAYAEIKNSSLSFLTAKVKYRRLWRNSDFQYEGASGEYDQYVRKYDVASKTQDTIKLGLEIDPLEHLTVGLEYSYKNNDYKDLYLGVRSDKRNEFYVDAAYEIPDVAKFTAFFDYETVKRASLLRSNSDFPPFDPNAGSTKTTYNVDVALEDSNYFCGLGIEVPIIKNRLNFVASWMYEKADGTTDFSTPNNWGAATFVSSDISNDYTKQSVDLKAIYKALKNLDLTLGYSYAHYAFSDPTINGYKYVYPQSGSPTSYLTGAYSDPGYNVNMVYFVASYKF